MRFRPSAVLESGLTALTRVVLLFSLFLLFAGHNRPGGGFVGGLVAAAAFVLVFVAGGGAAMRRAARFSPASYLGAGLLIAGLTGTAALLAGKPFLTGGLLEFDVPLLGTVKATSALAFDAGVYLVVVGLVLVVLAAFDPEGEA
jgi:multicomponent Na+:H+ antiporter subunit A